MSKHQQAGAIAQTARIEALEKGLAEANKRIDALLLIVEKLTHTERRPQVEQTASGTTADYKPAFDRWPNAR